jgi:tetratricopeptide (TPR) repeat protein
MTDDLKDQVAAGAQAHRDGHLDAAAGHYGVALTMARAQGEPLLIAHIARHLGDIYRKNGRNDKAEPLLKEAIAIYRSNLGTKVLDIANALRPLALLYTALGNKHSALELWQEARTFYLAIGINEGVAECDSYLSMSDFK